MKIRIGRRRFNQLVVIAAIATTIAQSTRRAPRDLLDIVTLQIVTEMGERA